MTIKLDILEQGVDQAVSMAQNASTPEEKREIAHLLLAAKKAVG